MGGIPVHPKKMSLGAAHGGTVFAALSFGNR
jgi:hypothetical protein